ncbi:nuclear transport factor 2 family protein [Fervidobacterium gondwanense]|uniref:SnoaL-like domain-containing protein n=1 Tax=Fervidobacterium gondwanense DSM 13020 TaxID=1121883 RepID=A0A1M7SJR1_FERGO|nr:nuclear transport factor 2 family protein [Fervidobacterium gondwanense]SHN58725.1 SnoaL-like domain-containing protein [Fervidobacterium gondwanense DSM 13020]
MERIERTENQGYTITSLEQLLQLWTKTYNSEGKPDWSHLLPYYDENIHFRDTVQEIHGIEEFKKMVERLTKRSQELHMNILNAVMDGNIIFVEWDMIINFRKTKTSVVHGASRLVIGGNGKIVDQRDYYDLWGDIFDNIPGFGKLYRKFMKRVFG